MQQTAYDMRISDWSSDVCSSYRVGAGGEARLHHGAADGPGLRPIGGGDVDQAVGARAGTDGLSLRSRILERTIVAWPPSTIRSSADWARVRQFCSMHVGHVRYKNQSIIEINYKFNPLYIS